MNPLVEVDQLCVRYPGSPRNAVNGVTFFVDKQECVAIVGESGSGKSTTALALLGLLGNDVHVSAETMSIGDTQLLGATPQQWRTLRRHTLGAVFQDPSASWNPARTVGNQVLSQFPRQERSSMREKFIQYMGEVGINRAAQRVNDYPHQFSGGMLQRAMIAGALLNEPQLLIADEPTSALDVTVQADLIRLLDRLRSTRALSLLIITHNLEVVRAIADRTVVMHSGNVVEGAGTNELLTKPIHPYTKSLLESLPGMSKRPKQPLPALEGNLVSHQGCSFSARCPLADDHCRTTVPDIHEVDGRKVLCHKATTIERGPHVAS